MMMMMMMMMHSCCLSLCFVVDEVALLLACASGRPLVKEDVVAEVFVKCHVETDDADVLIVDFILDAMLM